jgi:hypothetical protein
MQLTVDAQEPWHHPRERYLPYELPEFSPPARGWFVHASYIQRSKRVSPPAWGMVRVPSVASSASAVPWWCHPWGMPLMFNITLREELAAFLRAAPRNPGVERTHGYATRAFHHLSWIVISYGSPPSKRGGSILRGAGCRFALVPLRPCSSHRRFSASDPTPGKLSDSSSP